MTKLNTSHGNHMMTYGDDRVYSTVIDLEKWNKALFELDSDKPILSANSVSLMLEDREEGSKSYGLQKRLLGNLVCYGHGGDNIGFTNNLLYVPKKKLTIAVLSNVSPDLEFFTDSNLSLLPNIDVRNLESESELSLGESSVYLI